MCLDFLFSPVILLRILLAVWVSIARKNHNQRFKTRQSLEAHLEVIQMLELPNRKFKITRANGMNAVVEKADKVPE